MSREADIKLKQVLDNNRKWPMIVEGLTADSLEPSIILSASQVSAQELYYSDGYQPVWIQEMASKPDARFLVVNGLDTVDDAKQGEFVQLLKDRQAGFYKLPDSIQIVILVADLNKVSKKIQSLSLIWKHSTD